MRYGYKIVRPDGRTRHGFTWPLTPGESVESSDDIADGDHICPTQPGDGLSVGLAANGLASSGITSSTLLVVSWADSDTAAEDGDKARVVGPVDVVQVVDWHRAIREQDVEVPDGLDALWGRGADLRGAYLHWADLSGADLSGAYLYGAYLYRADLGKWERGDDGYAVRKANYHGS